MKRYVLLGTVGAGKSTLYAALHGIACDEAKKTQAMQYDLDGSGFCSEIACDHSRFTRAQRQDPYRFSAGNAHFFGEILVRVGDQMSNRNLFPWYEFLNDTCFFFHELNSPAHSLACISEGR